MVTRSGGLSSPNITSWLWDFGDGIGTSNLQDPCYLYNRWVIIELLLPFLIITILMKN